MPKNTKKVDFYKTVVQNGSLGSLQQSFNRMSLKSNLHYIYKILFKLLFLPEHSTY